MAGFDWLLRVDRSWTFHLSLQPHRCASFQLVSFHASLLNTSAHRIKMDAKAIQERAKALGKATQANESAAVLRILKQLKDGVVATEDLLRQTKIGVAVNRAKNASKDAAVQRMAGEIVRKWREEVSKETKRNSPSRRTSPSPAGAKNSTSGTASPAPGQASDVAPEFRTWKTDRVSTKRTDSAQRNACIGLLYDGLAYCSTEPTPHVAAVTIEVEAAAYAAHGPETTDKYRAKMRSLFQNLKNRASGPLRAQVLAGEIAPDRFVVMSHEELKSESRRAEDKAMENENMRAAHVPQAEKAISATLQCAKCGQRKVSYSQAQTRSADEPMTTFALCENCGKRWKVCLTGATSTNLWIANGRSVLVRCRSADPQLWFLIPQSLSRVHSLLCVVQCLRRAHGNIGSGTTVKGMAFGHDRTMKSLFSDAPYASSTNRRH